MIDRKLARWFAGLLTLVAAHSLMAGLVLSATEAAGWNDWGHQGLLLAIVPIVGLVCGKVVDIQQMNEYPPGNFLSSAMKSLPAAGPDVPPQTVEIDVRPGWGLYPGYLQGSALPAARNAVLVLGDGVGRAHRSRQVAGTRFSQDCADR